MAYFKRDRFSGIAPGVAPNLLAEQFGQIAKNIDFESGSLVPIQQEGSVDHTFTSSGSLVQSFYYYENSVTNRWLGFNSSNVNVVEGPIPGDTYERLYWTGESYPKMSVQTAIEGSGSQPFPAVAYRLGVPAPDSTPSVTKTGDADDTVTPDDVSYVYTFVTAYGEEGPPSTPSTTTEFTPSTQTATISIPSYGGASSAINFSKKRLYRSNTGSTNTTFQFVKEVPYATTSTTDSAAAATLGEVLPSSTWIGPPDDNTSLYPDGPLKGLTPIANGVFAGFTGKRLCLSEPYLPHAWPISYRITLEEDIVAIGTTANGVVCLTNGKPYFVTGVDPSAMSALQIDLAQACVNRNSVVDMGEYILYAGPDGLCAVSGTEGRVVTKGLISPEQWNADFKPSTIKAFLYEGTYVAFYEDGSDHKGWVYDPRADEAAISTLTTEYTVYAGWSDLQSGKLYILDAANSTANKRVREYRGSTTDVNKSQWKSKKYVVPQPVSMAWVGVYADSYPLPTNSDFADVLQIKVWADDTLIADYHLSYASNLSVYQQHLNTPSGSLAQLREPIMRLPAVVARQWEVEVQSTQPVREICLSQTMDEIKSA